MSTRILVCLLCASWFFLTNLSVSAAEGTVQRRLYVATPGIRNYLEYGGHGLVVFDIDQGHRFVKRIPTAGRDDAGKPLNVKGICASAVTRRIYVSTIKTLQALDLDTEKLIWERAYDNGCDRMALSPDGKVLYVPSLEGDLWMVVDGATGDVIARVEPKSGAHNTVYGLDGHRAYLAGLKSPLLTVAKTTSHTVEKTVGPFSASIRPFTINGCQTRCYVCINELLGFEVGDLTTNKMLCRVEVPGFKKGAVKRHGCPSHGIGLTPDETQVWVCDAFNQQMHVFDATVTPPRLIDSIKVRDEPGWITFSLDGTFAYPSTGDIIDVPSRKIVGGLTDETGAAVQSEKMVEIQFETTTKSVLRTGDQFGLGRVTTAVPRP